MNRAKLIADKHTLWAGIKRLGDYYCEDASFTQEYGKDVYNANLGDLNRAIGCFSELVKQTERLGGVTYHGKCRK